MSFVISLLVFLHILCWAIALGTWVAAARTKQPSKAMAHALGGVLVLGVLIFALTGIAGFGDHMWMGIKFVLALIATVFAFIAVKRREATPAPIWYGIPTLLVITIAYAVFGH